MSKTRPLFSGTRWTSIPTLSCVRGTTRRSLWFSSMGARLSSNAWMVKAFFRCWREENRATKPLKPTFELGAWLQRADQNDSLGSYSILSRTCRLDNRCEFF